VLRIRVDPYFRPILGAPDLSRPCVDLNAPDDKNNEENMLDSQGDD
jgi:hypothetical protein